MGDSRPTVLVTGAAGNLGSRLLLQFTERSVIGVDLKAPADPAVRFVSMDLEQESCCRELMLLLRESRPETVVHLAFVADAARAGILDPDRIWQINVAGTARIMEAITEANREEVVVRKFILTSSALVYGPHPSRPATEESPLQADLLPSARHQAEAEKVVRHRSPGLRGCSVYVLRPAIFAGASVDDYFVNAFRGVADGKAARQRGGNQRLSFLLPVGGRSMERRIQFVHVDDVARLIAYIVRKNEPEVQHVTVLNVAGRGEPLTYARCFQVAPANPLRLPGKRAVEMVRRLWWNRGTSAFPPEALPYLTGEWLIDTHRLQQFLGHDYEKVMHYTMAEAFEDSFHDAVSFAARSAAR
jgi:nucleoside-diphosphate-sugar epimerase